MDSEEAAAMVATAKQVLPKCYFMLGGAAAKAGNFEEAAAQFTKSATWQTSTATPTSWPSRRCG